MGSAEHLGARCQEYGVGDLNNEFGQAAFSSLVFVYFYTAP